MNLLDLFITIGGFTGFALSHSILANQSVKKWIIRRWPFMKPYYRITYSFISLVILGVWYWLSPFPRGLVYAIDWPWNLLMHAFQGGALIVFLFALKAVNLGRFIGFKQVVLNTSEADREPLVTSGLYRYVRHPLYSATIALLAFNPVMTAKLALITLLVAAYSWVGSIFEEQNLVELYGEEYVNYQKSVPRLIPKINF